MKCRIPRIKIHEPTKQQVDAALNQAMNWLREEALPIMARRIEAIYLWEIHTKCNAGKRKLLEIHDDIVPMVKQMLEEYEYNHDEDAMWICEHKLKTECGIDLSKLKSPFSMNAVFEEEK